MATAGTTEQRYDHKAIEAKWRDRWAADKLYRVRDDDPRPKWYELHMYPYPSGDLHIGHWYAMSGADDHARYGGKDGELRHDQSSLVGSASRFSASGCVWRPARTGRSTTIRYGPPDSSRSSLT